MTQYTKIVDSDLASNALYDKVNNMVDALNADKVDRAQLGLRKANTSYAVDKLCYCEYHPEFSLKCKTAGTTSGGALDTSGVLTEGQTINDGSVVWTVESSGQGGELQVVYGTTTYAEITTASAAKKNIVCFYGAYVYRYSYTTTTYHYLTCQATTTALRYIRVNTSNTWSAGSTTAQSAANLIGTTSTKEPTDSTYYSSAKVDSMLGDLMANSVKDQNHQTVGLKEWSGTLAEYEALKPTDSWYAWGDYFTKSENPQVGDKIYNSDKSDSGKVITAVSGNTITFE